MIAKRFHFHRRTQGSEESIADFVAGLQKLSIHCKFAGFLDDALRDRFVCGLRSEQIQRKLLTQAELTFSQAVDIAKAMEAAKHDIKQFQDQGTSIQAIQSHPLQSRGGATPQMKPCSHCGRTNHLPSQCYLKDDVCRRCQKKGHIGKICRSTRSSHTKSRNMKWVHADEAISNSDSHSESLPEPPPDSHPPIFKVNARGSHPITVQMSINGKPLQMEVDTGAAVSVISSVVKNQLFPDVPLAPPSVVLRTYTGEAMALQREMTVQVSYKDQQQTLDLMVVDGNGPSLLGRDWLQHFRLDWKTIGMVAIDKDWAQVELLKSKYKGVFAEGLGTMKTFTAHLKLKPDTKPVFYRPRPVPYALKANIEQELQRLEREGIIEKIEHSEWAAPIVPVPKGDGEIRICGDYKVTINPALEVDQHPLPKPEDLFASLAGGQKFTKLDLKHAYQQMELDQDSRRYVTINTHKGLYRYTRLPFGVASAPAVFQRTMDVILQGLPQVLCYLDDILVTGKTPKDHLSNLEEVLSRLHQYGVRLKARKCVFFQDSVDYLGHIINAEGLHMSPTKVAAVQEAPIPRNQTELRSFLGLLHYYGKFIPNLASQLYPLNELLKKGKSWKWTSQCDKAFKQAKSQLTSMSVLAHYDPSLPLQLAGDASAYGIGAVISHILPDGSERPISYASRTLTTSERNYAQLEKEALSLVYGVQKFHAYLYGRPFILFTDHKPLTTILAPSKSVPPLAAACLQRWALLLSSYDYRIVFRPTKAHANADGLSHLPVPYSSNEPYLPDPKLFNIQQIETLPLMAAQLKTATARDPELSKVLTFTKTGWPLKVPPVLLPYWNRREELSVESDCVLWGIRVIIPRKFRTTVLQEIHHTHMGIVRMKMIARSYVWWP